MVNEDRQDLSAIGQFDNFGWIVAGGIRLTVVRSRFRRRDYDVAPIHLKNDEEVIGRFPIIGDQSDFAPPIQFDLRKLWLPKKTSLPSRMIAWACRRIGDIFLTSTPFTLPLILPMTLTSTPAFTRASRRMILCVSLSLSSYISSCFSAPRMNSESFRRAFTGETTKCLMTGISFVCSEQLFLQFGLNPHCLAEKGAFTTNSVGESFPNCANWNRIAETKDRRSTAGISNVAAHSG